MGRAACRHPLQAVEAAVCVALVSRPEKCGQRPLRGRTPAWRPELRKPRPFSFLLGMRFLALATLLITGCTSTNRKIDSRLDLAMPSEWTGEHSHSAEATQPWLLDFDDETLTLLVREAALNNFSLKAAFARLDAALATARISRADLLPDVETSLAASRSQRITGSGSSPATLRSSAYGLQLSTRWELDLWGRVRDQVRAARADLQATAAGVRAARLSLAAQVARTWFDAIAAEQQVGLAEQTVAVFKTSQEVIEGRFRRGLSSALDVRLGRAGVANAESRLAARRLQRDQTVRVLEVLLGRYPASELDIAEDFPSMKQEVPVGLPSHLLARRPDILAAERRLAASEARLSREKKNRLPSFGLTASGGTSSDALKQLLNINYLVWNLAANVTQPLFNTGRLKARSSLAKATRNEALESYAEVALQAFREVESALAAESLLETRETALNTASDESTEAEGLALDEYTRGLVGIITLLDSQRRTFVAKSDLIEVKNQRLQNRTRLYLALGGGFMGTEEQR